MFDIAVYFDVKFTLNNWKFNLNILHFYSVYFNINSCMFCRVTILPCWVPLPNRKVCFLSLAPSLFDSQRVTTPAAVLVAPSILSHGWASVQTQTKLSRLRIWFLQSGCGTAKHSWRKMTRTAKLAKTQVMFDFKIDFFCDRWNTSIYIPIFELLSCHSQLELTYRSSIIIEK